MLACAVCVQWVLTGVKVLCFGSRVFGLDMKKVIPLVTLDAVERADLRLTLVSRPPAAKEVTYVLVFSDLVQTESAHQLIGAVVSAAKEQAKEDDADAPHTNVRPPLLFAHTQA